MSFESSKVQIVYRVKFLWTDYIKNYIMDLSSHCLLPLHLEETLLEGDFTLCLCAGICPHEYYQIRFKEWRIKAQALSKHKLDRIVVFTHISVLDWASCINICRWIETVKISHRQWWIQPRTLTLELPKSFGLWTTWAYAIVEQRRLTLAKGMVCLSCQSDGWFYSQTYRQHRIGKKCSPSIPHLLSHLPELL